MDSSGDFPYNQNMRVLFLDRDEGFVEEVVKLLGDDLAIHHFRSVGEGERKAVSEPFDLIVLSPLFEEEEERLDELLSLWATPNTTLLRRGGEEREGADGVVSGKDPQEAAKEITGWVDSLRKGDGSAYLIALSRRFLQMGIAGKGRSMFEVYGLIDKVAPLNVTVLLSGESGTGKELFARAIHAFSGRSGSPFVPIHCGAIPENLLEDELFGHVKGSFTNALYEKAGKFEAAQGGTIFLDEISTMSPLLQIKLLRVLQEREVERIGSNRLTKVDVRVVAATNRNLKEMIDRGEFREDLFYRLNVFPVQIPPLRERREDIPLIAAAVLNKFCREQGLPQKTYSLSLLQQLQTLPFPGNVRELENLVQRMVVLSGPRQTLLPSDLPAEYATVGEALKPGHPLTGGEWADGIPLATVVHSVEKQLILRSLEKTGGNKKRAADLLQIKRTTLLEKMKKLDLLTEIDKEGGS